MFHNISNPKWFGNWSRLEDDYLGNGGTDIADNFTFSKMEKTGGLFGSIISLATAFPAYDPETGHATGAWKVACESIDLDEVPLSDIADMISSFDCETITDFRLFNTGAFDDTPWQQALGELLLRLRVEKDDYQWIQCPNSESAVNMMNMVMDAHMPKDFFRHRGDGKSRVSLPARLLEGRGDGGFLHRSKRRYRSRGLRPRDRGEPVAHGWRDCPRGRVLHRYQ